MSWEREKRRTAAVNELVEAATGRGAKVPHLAELAEHLLAQWGGPLKFAKAFHAEFHNNPSKSLIRARMLETVIRMIQANTTMGGETEDLGHLNEQDLKRMAAELIGTKKGDGTDAAGQVEAADAGADNGNASLAPGVAQ